jgi:hypothetical protein
MSVIQSQTHVKKNPKLEECSDEDRVDANMYKHLWFHLDTYMQ